MMASEKSENIFLLSNAEMNTGEVWSSDDGDHRHARKHVICAVAAMGKLSR